MMTFTPCASAAPRIPEAPCSVNAKFPVPGYSQYFQATGRGHTPTEAANNLRDTIDATQAAMAVAPPPPSRTTRLATLLASGLHKATAHQNWALVERLAKAAALVLADAVQPSDADATYTVQSQRDAQHRYAVDATARTCTCPDALHRESAKGAQCKHVLAVLMTHALASPCEDSH